MWLSGSRAHLCTCIDGITLKKKASAKGTNTDTRTTDSYELID